MAKHKVQIKQMPEVEILSKDLSVSIYSGEKILGFLTLSRGGVGWNPNNAKLERHFTWEQFDRIIREHRG